MKIQKKGVVFLAFLLFLTILMLFPILGHNVLQAQDYEDDPDELGSDFFIMKDAETRETIMRTARIINPGDEYINSENDLYRVGNIEGNIAWATHVERITLREVPPDEWLQGALAWEGTIEESQQKKVTPPTIGVYHSHGAESYVPSDGTESIPEGGGILDVGDSFTASLRDNGLNVIHVDKTHVPHDAGAYYRSRRTCEELLGKGVDVLFDIHRDAVPAEEYLATVDGEGEEVQLQFVVGQQNQNMDVNQSFAESLKSVTDSIYPNLVKGIFLARGNYNQDMIPLSLLIEVGSHENKKERAEESMTLFADAVSTYFVGPQGRQTSERTGGTALRSVLWVVLIAGLVLGLYLLISTENLEELRAKVNHFFKKEFAEMGRRRGGGGEENREDGGGGGENG